MEQAVAFSRCLFLRMVQRLAEDIVFLKILTF